MTLAARVLFLILFVCAIAACRGSSGIEPLPATSKAPGWHEGTLTHDGLERAFRVYVPEGLADSAAMPADSAHVVMLLHGGTQSMDAIFRPRAGGTQEWRHVADDENLLLLVPNGVNPKTGSPTGDHQVWNDCRKLATDDVTRSTADDVGFLMQLTQWAGARFPVNPERLTVTGASNGGQMAYRLAIERPDHVAAIAAFIANLPAESECAAPTVPVPVLMVNGTEDPLMPYEGGSTDGRGTFYSSPATRSIWVRANRADTSRRTTRRLPDRDPKDGSIVVCEEDPGGAAGAPVQFCRVEGGGHSMPSRQHKLSRFVERFLGPQNHDVEGARMAWAFLQRQTSRGSRSTP